MDDLLSGLNAAQREAVTATEGYIRVIAAQARAKRAHWRGASPTL